MKKKLFMLILAIAVAVVCAIPVSAEAENGWVESNGDWFYYENGTMYSNCIRYIDGSYYAFNYNGSMYDAEGLYDIYTEIDDVYRTVVFYVTADDGKLLTNAWKEAKLYDTDEEYSWFYFQNNGTACTDGMYQLGDSYYFFNYYGKMQTGFFYNEGKDYYADEDGKLKVNSWFEAKRYEYQDSYDWFYASGDGSLYCDTIANIGGTLYGFNYNGEMYNDCTFSQSTYDDDNNYLGYFRYRAKDGGELCRNTWYEDTYGNWYYYLSDGKAAEGLVNLGGQNYFFAYDGRMLEDTCYTDYTEETARFFVIDKDGIAKEVYNNNWAECDGKWYYVQNNQFCEGGIYTIGGVQYGFSYNGQMYDDCSFSAAEYDENDNYLGSYYYRAQKGGELYRNTWYEDTYGDWYYYFGDGKAAEGLVTIGGKTYIFSEYSGQMLVGPCCYTVEEDDTTRFFIIDEDGSVTEVYNNNWAECDGKWYYVQNNRFCEGGIYTIGGVQYGFNYNGEMYDNKHFSVSTYSDYDDSYYTKYYFAKPGGAVAVNEWIEYIDVDSYSKNSVWYYASADGSLYNEGIYAIGGKYYAFGYQGTLQSGSVYKDDGKYYLLSSLDEGGHVVETPGWYKHSTGYSSEWVYVNAEGSLHVGWLNDKYYMTPFMTYATYFCEYDEKPDGSYSISLYLSNTTGDTKKVTTDGFYTVTDADGYDPCMVYVKNGSVVADEWIESNGSWYYFGGDGSMFINALLYKNGTTYYMDRNGVMACNGWVMTKDGDWYYANPDGSLYSGIDSAGYVFASNGRLVVNGIYYADNGNVYYTDGNGIIKHTFAYGWNNVNGKWYYLDENGSLASGGTKTIQGHRYGFNYNGEMVENCVWYGYLFGADGKQVINNWLLIDNEWYYGNEYGTYDTGIYRINGNEYYFENNVLQQNKTLYSYSERALITTDSEGIVIERAVADGWFYKVNSSYPTNGNAYYYENGKAFDGWLGSYYIDYGTMAIDRVIKWKDSYYYLNNKGIYISGGWYERYNSWMFARSDGSLYFNEWLQYNGQWYYFNYETMAYDGIYEIDGALHSFDENGIWLGQVYEDNYDYADGWAYVNGAWRYFNAGVAVCDRMLYIDDAWYAFDYGGAMIENDTYYGYYFMANGKRAEYTGWVELSTGWCYFNGDYTVDYGWVQDGNSLYFQEYTGRRNKATNKFEYGYAIIEDTYRVIDGILYHFNASGIMDYTITETGWYELEGQWYYVQNGLACYGEIYEIGNTSYAFYYDGMMVCNALYDGHYFDASGAMVTASGWYYFEDGDRGGWIYVLEGGRIAGDGVYLIDGYEYYFDNNFWVE